MQPKLAHQSETQRIYTKNTLKKLKESDVSFLDLNFKTVDFEFDIYGPTFSLNLDSTVFQVGKCRKGLVPKALLDTLEHHRSPRARIKWTRHVEQCQRRLYKGEDCQGKMRKWSWPMKRCLGPGKCFCWEDMLGHNSFSGQSGKPREAKTSYAGMGNSHGWSVKMRRPGARDQETREGGKGAVSLSQLLLSCLSWSQCLSVSQDTIGPNSSRGSLIAPLVFGHNWVVLSHCQVYCTSEPQLLIREATPTLTEREMKVDRLQFGGKRGW